VTLEVSHFAQGRKVLSLTVCPACGYEFDEDEDRFHHLGEHAPEDFGLSPLGEVGDDHQAPLFPEIEDEYREVEFDREPDVGAEDRRGRVEQ